jgi:hypothetical protein
MTREFRITDIKGATGEKDPRNLVLTGPGYITEISLDDKKIRHLNSEGLRVQNNPRMGDIYSLTEKVGKFLVEKMTNGQRFERYQDGVYFQTGVKSPFIKN